MDSLSPSSCPARTLTGQVCPVDSNGVLPAAGRASRRDQTRIVRCSAVGFGPQAIVGRVTHPTRKTTPRLATLTRVAGHLGGAGAPGIGTKGLGMATAKIETGNIKIEVSDDATALAVLGAIELLKGCMKTPLLTLGFSSNLQPGGSGQFTPESIVCIPGNQEGVIAFGVPSRS